MAALWAPKLIIEKRYIRSIQKIMKQFELLAQGKDEPEEILKAWKEYAQSAAFQKAAEDIACRMVTNLFSDGQKSWREAARVNSRGRAIYEALKEELTGPVGAVYGSLISQNSKLIRTLPEAVAEQVTAYIAKEQQKGRRASEIAGEITRLFPEKTRARAELIARTEVSKASTALIQARSELLGLRWYVWRTSEDQRVRDSHELMEGVIIAWSNPPSPEALNQERSYGHYHAGNTFNCRCYPEPLVEVEAIRWPHKVYYQNRIQMMTLAQFKRIA